MPVRELEVEKTYITEESEAISTKLEDLKDIIEQIKVRNQSTVCLFGCFQLGSVIDSKQNSCFCPE